MFRKKVVIGLAIMMVLIGTGIPALAAESETINVDTNEVSKNAVESNSSIRSVSDLFSVFYYGFTQVDSPPVHTFDSSTNTVTFKDYIFFSDVSGSYDFAHIQLQMAHWVQFKLET